jgi:hypothetical protein
MVTGLLESVYRSLLMKWNQQCNNNFKHLCNKQAACTHLQTACFVLIVLWIYFQKHSKSIQPENRTLKRQ